MILDAKLQPATANATVRAAGDYLGEDTIDLSLARDPGLADLLMAFTVDVAFAGGTSVEFQVVTSASADLSSPTVVCSTGAIPEASLTAGALFELPIRAVVGNGQRYMGVRAVGVGIHTAGTFTASVVKDAPNHKYHASGYTNAA